MSNVRFTVSKPGTEDVPLGEGTQDGPGLTYGSLPGGDNTSVQIIDSNGQGAKFGEDTKNRENIPLAGAEEQANYGQMALYEEDLSERGKISQILATIGKYQAGITPDPNDVENSAKKPQSAKLGLLMGVYLPCIQNIFGVILFIRLTWLVGNAGLVESFFIVLICCMTTMLTAISMSAIATNGVVPGGGAYFMISRALGPEFGGAVGVLFYLGTSVASSMYIIGAVEILVTYIAPSISIFGDITIVANAFNNFRVYGTCLLIVLIICVFVGVSFVSKFAPISLFCVLLSIVSIYIGIFAANPDESVRICMLGDRLLTREFVTDNGVFMCNKTDNGPIYMAYCVNETDEALCKFYEENDVVNAPGIPGLASGIVNDNIFNKYSIQGNIPGSEEEASRSRGEVMADITTSFTVLLAIFFPSVTGIMAGSNRSGDLADAQGSIPRGTISAIATTSIVYLTCVLFFAGTITGELMRDKFGESIGGGLVVANLAWPHPYVILVGSFLSTVGAGLQSLTGAPRLLQAIAQDGVLPFLNVFKVTTKKGEPMRAILLTAAISEIGILIASLDYVAPIITMFFLMCYGFVNMACALQTLLRTPNWRPRFRFYHWTLSLLGLAMCIALMFISSWYYALLAIALAVCIYKYIEYKGAEKEWGDGIRGLAMSAARYALLNLEQGPPHTKNWRPQLLVLMKLDSNLKPKYTQMVTFAGQLKAGKGLTMLASVLQGHHRDRFADGQAAKQALTKLVQETGVKAFADILIAKNVTEGLSHIIQAAGLGGLKHNTVVLGWPYGWRHSPDVRSYRVFLDTVKNVIYSQLCLLVVKGVDMFPPSSQKLSGTIDVWWIVHEGGLLMLLPFLLRQHKTWKNCRLRIFTVAQLEDNSIQMKKDLEHYLYQLRIEAEVAVIEMNEGDISAYTYERTLMMEQRTEMLKEMRVKDIKAPQVIVDKAHTPTHRNVPKIKLTSVPEEPNPQDSPSPPSSLSVSVSDINQFTFSPQNSKSVAKEFGNLKPNDRNVRRMHTAVRLNETIVDKSHSAHLVILNMPAPPKSEAGEENYMEYLEVLCEGLERVLMVRGSGREVITIYS
ncbi:solute carrier family 12 member 4-like isoform X2 [Liolophura sinensis]|uniref:solute carrier family 12 member 4-like isoform X2 n=1 Tax=Liolophura sinensis TaxID=3198878 RepID=UPI003158E1B9